MKLFLPYVMIVCLIFTVLIEITTALILKINKKKDLLNIVLVNIMTNPLVVALIFFINKLYNVIIANLFLLATATLTQISKIIFI